MKKVRPSSVVGTHVNSEDARPTFSIARISAEQRAAARRVIEFAEGERPTQNAIEAEEDTLP